MPLAALRADVRATREVHEVIERRSCVILRVDRSALDTCRTNRGMRLQARLRNPEGGRRRFSYRRPELLQHEGVRFNYKKLRRVYAEEQ